jgi:hypothetical protein
MLPHLPEIAFSIVDISARITKVRLLALISYLYANAFFFSR